MSQRLVTRDRWRTVLLIYGIGGLVIAGIIAVAGLGAIDRLTTVGADLVDRTAAIEMALDDAVLTIDEAASTATSFAGSIDQATVGLSAIRSSLGSLSPALRTFEAQTSLITILGERPLAGLAAQAAILATDIDTMAASVDRITRQLPDDGAAIVRLGASLRTLAGDVRTVRGSVATTIDALSDTDGGTELRLLWVLITVSLAAPPALALLTALALGPRGRAGKRRMVDHGDAPGSGDAADRVDPHIR